MQLLRRTLILVHRYLGIPLSFLFVIWFVSGIAMIYVGGMPQLSAEERLEHLPELDLAAVRLTPSEAAARAEIGTPGGVALLPVLGRPAYRFGGRGGATTVFADDGASLDAVDLDAEQTIAARFVGAPESAVRFMHTVESPDQWTLGAEPRAASREIRGRRRSRHRSLRVGRRCRCRACHDDAHAGRSRGSRRFRIGSTSRRCARINRCGIGPSSRPPGLAACLR